MDVCKSLGLPSWTVDETGTSLQAVNAEGERFLRVLPKGSWMDALDKDSIAEVRRSLSFTSSPVSRRPKVARVSFARSNVKGHVLCLPLADEELISCLVFVQD